MAMANQIGALAELLMEMQSRMDQHHDSLMKIMEANTSALQDLCGKSPTTSAATVLAASSDERETQFANSTTSTEAPAAAQDVSLVVPAPDSDYSEREVDTTTGAGYSFLCSASPSSACVTAYEYSLLAISNLGTEVEPAATSLVPGSAATYVSCNGLVTTNDGKSPTTSTTPSASSPPAATPQDVNSAVLVVSSDHIEVTHPNCSTSGLRQVATILVSATAFSHVRCSTSASVPTLNAKLSIPPTQLVQVMPTKCSMNCCSGFTSMLTSSPPTWVSAAVVDSFDKRPWPSSQAQVLREQSMHKLVVCDLLDAKLDVIWSRPPWPPPMLVEILGCQVEDSIIKLRPTPWPSFSCSCYSQVGYFASVLGMDCSKGRKTGDYCIQFVLEPVFFKSRVVPDGDLGLHQAYTMPTTTQNIINNHPALGKSCLLSQPVNKLMERCFHWKFWEREKFWGTDELPIPTYDMSYSASEVTGLHPHEVVTVNKNISSKFSLSELALLLLFRIGMSMKLQVCTGLSQNWFIIHLTREKKSWQDLVQTCLCALLLQDSSTDTLTWLGALLVKVISSSSENEQMRALDCLDAISALGTNYSLVCSGTGLHHNIVWVYLKAASTPFVAWVLVTLTEVSWLLLITSCPAISFVMVILGINIAEANWECMVYLSGVVTLDFFSPVVLFQSCHDAISFDSEACCKLTCGWIITPKLFYFTAGQERSGFNYQDNCQAWHFTEIKQYIPQLAFDSWILEICSSELGLDVPWYNQYSLYFHLMADNRRAVLHFYQELLLFDNIPITVLWMIALWTSPQGHTEAHAVCVNWFSDWARSSIGERDKCMQFKHLFGTMKRIMISGQAHVLLFLIFQIHLQQELSRTNIIKDQRVILWDPGGSLHNLQVTVPVLDNFCVHATIQIKWCNFSECAQPAFQLHVRVAASEINIKYWHGLLLAKNGAYRVSFNIRMKHVTWVPGGLLQQRLGDKPCFKEGRMSGTYCILVGLLGGPLAMKMDMGQYHRKGHQVQRGSNTIREGVEDQNHEPGGELTLEASICSRLA